MHAGRSWRGQIAAALLILAASAVGLAVHLEKPLAHRPAGSPVPSVTLLPAVGPNLPALPDCSGDRAPVDSHPYVDQQADGGFTGCLRVDALPVATYPVIARGSPSIVGPAATTEVLDSIEISPSEGPPGTRVTLTGSVPSPPGPGQDDHVPLCWDACDVLGYSAEAHWSTSSPGRFEIPFQVPAAPWMTRTGVHPLITGRYRVILPCIPDILDKPSGCRGEQRFGTFQLTGPVPSLCRSTQPCAALELNPTAGPPGSVVGVRGWAPLVGLGGHAQVFLQLRTAFTAMDSMPALATAPFRVTAGPDWASLGALQPASIARSGWEGIGVDPTNPRRFAYCSGTSIQVTLDAGQHWSSIPLQAAWAASAATDYPLVPNFRGDPPSCGAVALDPSHSASLYAMFDTLRRNAGGNPDYFVAYVTTDGGGMWRPVPLPAGMDMGTFGGFRADASGVRALFFLSQAEKFEGRRFIVQQTIDGGRTWTSGRLACPRDGPCIALGPQDNGRCMLGEWESIEISPDGGRRWTTPDWPSQLQACRSFAELVGFSSGMLARIDMENPYPLLVSSDGGTGWTAIELPANPSNAYYSIQFLPDGRLLSSGSTWSLLGAGAGNWCPVLASPPVSVVPILIGDQFWWVAQDGSLGSFPVSALNC
jgi:hypothetical protein